MRWILDLQEYQFDIEHKPGKSMGHDDGLSRAGFNPPSEESACPDHDPKANKDKVVGTIGIPGYASRGISRAQRSDEILKPIFEYLENGVLPTDRRQARQISMSADRYLIDPDGVLKRLDFMGPRGHEELN